MGEFDVAEACARELDRLAEQSNRLADESEREGKASEYRSQRKNAFESARRWRAIAFGHQRGAAQIRRGAWKPFATPSEVIQRGIKDGYVDEEALEAINLEVKVTF